ncbi:MAG TPA: hypothetical protein VLA97_01445 [Nocardioidaceae bacterium]|nr:hypothetical protein [Nocardioidaceae bacterium]
MRGAEPEHARGILQEAFTAGWQAALAVNITNPRVLAVIESCFEMWLEEAGDEEEVLGLVFRGRDDLPGSTVRPRTGDGRPDSEPVAQPAAANGRRRVWGGVRVNGDGALPQT